MERRVIERIRDILVGSLCGTIQLYQTSFTIGWKERERNRDTSLHKGSTQKGLHKINYQEKGLPSVSLHTSE